MPSHPGSFRPFMETHLFQAVNLAPARIHFLNGAAPDLDAECERYEQEIEAAAASTCRFSASARTATSASTSLATSSWRARIA